MVKGLEGIPAGWRGAGAAALLAAVVLASSACGHRHRVHPVNVAGGVFFNQLCPRAHPIYTVPADKLLIIEDASATASNTATASTAGDPGIVTDVPITMSLRTNPTGTIPIGSADHVIVSRVGLPTAGGRPVRAYAAPGTQVLFLLGGCTASVNATVYFAGQLVPYPPPPAATRP
jgi:hypothetical protein